MPTSHETVLGIIPGSNDGERMVINLCHEPGTGSHLELCQQSWGEGLGWFTQSSVRLEPHQVADLRNLLASGNASARLPRSYRRVSDTAAYPRVVQAETA